MTHKVAALLFVVLLANIVFGFALVVVPALAQNPVPPTAREAAASPAFASRLAHSSTRAPAGPPRRAPSQEQVIYANGPVNGICDIGLCTVDAWAINYGYTISNTFDVSQATISGFNLAFWFFPDDGEKLLSLDWSIGTTAFASDIAQGTVSGLNLSDQFLFTNSYGYNIHSVGVSGLNVPVGTGTYWVTFGNGVTNNGDPLYWDENGGPSLAQESAVGTIPSESFNVDSGNGPPPPCSSNSAAAKHSIPARADGPTPASADGTFEVIHRFNFPGDYPAAPPTMDKAGSLYGTTSGDGIYTGKVYKLSPYGTGWVLPSVYSFPGGADGAGPVNPVTIGQDGNVYGTAGGGTGCNGNGCGIVFKLIPPVSLCPTVLCPTTTTVLYRFLGGSDGADPTGALVFDGAGNIYGMTSAGGAFGKGTIYELSPTDHGWVETVLYSFGGSPDGAYPAGSVILDQSGNLYGAAKGGGSYDCGTIFQLTPSGLGWAEKTLYTFEGSADGRYPVGVVHDSAGSLYGLAELTSSGAVFMLSPGQDTWSYSSIYSYSSLWGGDSLTIDAKANLYVAVPIKLSESSGYVFELTPSGGQWTYTELHDFSGDGYGILPTGLMVDTRGNIYGSAGYGSAGFLFEITP
jgi:uncharacterized repeat protein (TIGR03803 family)